MSVIPFLDTSRGSDWRIARRRQGYGGHQKQGGTFFRYDPIPNGGGSDYPELTIATTVKRLGTWYQYNGQSWNPNRYLVRTADGTRHDLRYKDYDVDVNSTVYNGLERMRAVDGTFMEYRESDNVSNGTQVSFASGKVGRMRDANGNKITFSGNQMTDTMGRVVDRTVNGDMTTVKVPEGVQGHVRVPLRVRLQEHL